MLFAACLLRRLLHFTRDDAAVCRGHFLLFQLIGDYLLDLVFEPERDLSDLRGGDGGGDVVAMVRREDYNWGSVRGL